MQTAFNPEHAVITATEKAINEKIEKLEAKLKQQKAKRQQIEARRKSAESKAARAKDTRRKILVGAAILAKVDRGEWPRDKLIAMLDTTLTRNDDRALFELDPLERGS